MNRQEHLKVDRFTFGKEYNQVHSWLDETYNNYARTNPYKHWLERHNYSAIKLKYGEFTLEFNAAYLHILFDYLSHFGIAFVPKDEEETRSMLKSQGVL